MALGWLAERVEVIDEDLGQSGAGVEGRTGFKRLAENIVRGLVGALLAIEVSRLARSSADWHQLLEICRLADVVIADEHSVYNPRDYNDKLLLGVKGTLSEAELNWMRLRLEGGRLNKVRRGEFFFLPPAGYDWDASTSTFRMSADQEVEQAVRLIFERFRLDGSAHAVFRYLPPARDQAAVSRCVGKGLALGVASLQLPAQHLAQRRSMQARTRTDAISTG